MLPCHTNLLFLKACRNKIIWLLSACDELGIIYFIVSPFNFLTHSILCLFFTTEGSEAKKKKKLRQKLA